MDFGCQKNNIRPHLTSLIIIMLYYFADALLPHWNSLLTAAKAGSCFCVVVKA